jgi:carboxymethylenebutenolidase
MERKGRVDVERVIGDVLETIEVARAMRACNGRVAVIGFCFGGRYAYYAATRATVDVAFAIHPTDIGISLNGSAVRSPLSLHFGGADALVPPSEVEQIRGGIGNDPKVEIFVYPTAGHSFAIPGADGYDEAAAALAQERIFQKLRDQGPGGPE